MYLSAISHSTYSNALQYLPESAIKSFPNHLDIVLSFIEKSRSHALTESISKMESYQNMGLPDNIILLDNTLKMEIRELEFKLSILNHEDQIEKDQIEDRLYEKHLRQDEFIRYLKQNHPQYFSIKYDQKQVCIKELQKYAQRKNRTVLEFLWGDSSIYAIAISEDTAKFYKIPDAASIEFAINQLTSLISNGVNIETISSDFNQYNKHAFYLYNRLLKPAFEDNPCKNLSIIPDGKLSTLPFEALITEEVISKKVDYKNLPYLLKTHQISFSNSAVFLLKHQDAKQVENETVLLFGTGQNIEIDNSMPNLSGTLKEVNNISKLFDTKSFIDNHATKVQFKSYASQYQLIHLAMHNLTDSINPLNTSLVFNDSLGKLFLHELYGLNLKARLAVLSACETGIGKYHKGEGVFSMGRSFAYAGCQSLILSLWKVDDLKTAEIMTGFYSELKKGSPLDQALVKSKKDYLKNADHLTAHPYHWAAFISWGANNPVMKAKSNQVSTWLSISLIILLSILSVFIYRRIKVSK
ncbi:MAG: CHAT domain-containing protein [Flavobacteriales bacterium]|nr:CHAT domain-containing protein [Flavobacteriales bacterium]